MMLWYAQLIVVLLYLMTISIYTTEQSTLFFLATKISPVSIALISIFIGMSLAIQVLIRQKRIFLKKLKRQHQEWKNKMQKQK